MYICIIVNISEFYRQVSSGKIQPIDGNNEEKERKMEWNGKIGNPNADGRLAVAVAAQDARRDDRHETKRRTK